VRSGLRHAVIPPGRLNCPPHWHTGEEEIFVVLDGAGEALLGDETFPLDARRGARAPAGTGVAHALRAARERSPMSPTARG